MNDHAYRIRAMAPEDVAGAVELLNGTSASDIRPVLLAGLTDSTAPPLLAAVATRADTIVGAAMLTANPVFPGTFSALTAVDENTRGLGIGTALAELVDAELRLLEDAGTATCSIRDDVPRGRAFAERHGFTVLHHSLGFRLRLTDGGHQLAAQAAEKAARAGVRIRKAAMASEEDLISECFKRCRTGLPLPYGDRPVDVRARLREFPSGTVYLLAEPLDAGTGRPRAMSVLIPQGESWYVRFTGTDPDFRGRGAASAVKAASLLCAHRAGARSITTHNDESNTPIIRANTALGMVPDVGYWSLSRPVPGVPAA